MTYENPNIKKNVIKENSAGAISKLLRIDNDLCPLWI